MTVASCVKPVPIGSATKLGGSVATMVTANSATITPGPSSSSPGWPASVRWSNAVTETARQRLPGTSVQSLRTADADRPLKWTTDAGSAATVPLAGATAATDAANAPRAARAERIMVPPIPAVPS